MTPWGNAANAIGLAANASVHFAVFAIALLVPFIWDALRSEADRRVWLGVGLGIAGIALAMWQLWPPADGQFPARLFSRFELFRIRDTLSQAFAPRARGGQWTLVLGVIFLSASAPVPATSNLVASAASGRVDLTWQAQASPPALNNAQNSKPY